MKGIKVNCCHYYFAGNLISHPFFNCNLRHSLSLTERYHVDLVSILVVRSKFSILRRSIFHLLIFRILFLIDSLCFAAIFINDGEHAILKWLAKHLIYGSPSLPATNLSAKDMYVSIHQMWFCHLTGNSLAF